jgi:hypothetical protein
MKSRNHFTQLDICDAEGVAKLFVEFYFGKYVAIELSGDNKPQLFIPRVFAHGFAALSEEVAFA